MVPDGTNQPDIPYTSAVSMKRKWLAGLFFVTRSAIGCDSAADTVPNGYASTNPGDYIGEYIFRPSSNTPQDFASFVILKKDQTAVEIRFFKNTGQIQTTQKRWYLYLHNWRECSDREFFSSS